MAISIDNIEKVNRNLFKHGAKYYRLFAKGTTPNDCWLVAPVMRELVDIDTATGRDVYGDSTIEFDVTGSVRPQEFILLEA